ncbi:MAG: preprotein translocase subunit SecG [Hyphomicrobiaceae bacterium]
MSTVLLVIHLLIAAGLVGVVLLQRSEGGALGIGGGGGGGFMTGRGTANLLTRATAILAGLFFLTSIGLTLLALQGRGNVSPLDAGGSTPVSAPAKSGEGTAAPDTSKEPPRGGVLDSLEKGRQQLPQVPKSQ